MRLLHTTTYELQTFHGSTPPYAILSHTWGEHEFGFRDAIVAVGREHHPGWPKVAKCCQRAATDGWEYVWIDTCCIDKNDITELGEAINSMFRWYAEAQICFAYLADVSPKYTRHPDESIDGRRGPWTHEFRRSRWFSRGWTLQEMLAPSHLLFLDKHWGTIGSREVWEDEVYMATGITPEQQSDFYSTCLATKLSWAANRQTTREEDRAYSLLGLLGVHMPLIYGEGKRAFVRLQHELIRTYADETIFAWTRQHVDIGAAHGILAPSPEFFQSPSPLYSLSCDLNRKGFTMNNIGLSLRAEVFEVHAGQDQSYAIKLNCSVDRSLPSEDYPVVLILKPYEILHAIYKCTGIEFQGDQLSGLTSVGVQDIIIRNETGIEVESPKAYLVTEVTFLYSDRVRIQTDKLMYFRPFYPREGQVRKVRYDPTIPSKFLVGDNGVRLNQAAAFVLPLKVLEYKGGPKSLGCEFAIVVKAAVPRPIIGIWRFESKSLAAVDRFIQYINWDRERKYPRCARTDQGEVVRISIWYTASTAAQVGLDAVLHIAIEENESQIYKIDRLSTGVVQDPTQPLSIGIPKVAPLATARHKTKPLSASMSATGSSAQKPDPFEDLLTEFNALF